MSQKQELHLQQMATRSRAEVEEELEIMAEILPTSEDSKKLLTMLFIELHHWLFADKADEHPKPSELLLQILTAKDDFGTSGAGPKKPTHYDA